MANAWYYAIGEERHGPVSSADLKTLAASGALTQDDLIWKEGLEDWRPASELKGLFSTTPEPTGPAQVAAPAEGPDPIGFPAVGLPDDPAPVINTSPARPTRRQPRGHSGAWQIPLIAGSVLLITAMFLPWWSFRIKGKQKDFEEAYQKNFSTKEEPLFKDEKTEEPGGRPNRFQSPPDEEKLRKFGKKITSSFGWYLHNWSAITLDSNSWDRREGQSDLEVDISGKVWGCNINLGLGAAFVGFAVLPLAITMLILPAVRQFSWASSFLAAYASLIIWVLSLLWYLDTPGFDVKPVFTQNASVGPYLALGGSLLLLVFGLIDGISGLRAFLRSRQLA